MPSFRPWTRVRPASGRRKAGARYMKGASVGTAKLTQVTVGAQLGGQSYAEVIFFETQRALDEFKDGKTAISAGVSAAVAADGAGAEAKYQHGVLVYTVDRSGLMFEASIGGQHFSFRPIDSGRMEPAAVQAAPGRSGDATVSPPPLCNSKPDLTADAKRGPGSRSPAPFSPLALRACRGISACLDCWA